MIDNKTTIGINCLKQITREGMGVHLSLEVKLLCKSHLCWALCRFVLLQQRIYGLLIFKGATYHIRRYLVFGVVLYRQDFYLSRRSFAKKFY